MKAPSCIYLRHSGTCRNPDTTQAEIMEFSIVNTTGGTETMAAELVDGRCHTPLDSDTGSRPTQAENRNDELHILMTGFGFDEACPSCLQAVDKL